MVRVRLEKLGQSPALASSGRSHTFGSSTAAADGNSGSFADANQQTNCRMLDLWQCVRYPVLRSEPSILPTLLSTKNSP